MDFLMTLNPLQFLALQWGNNLFRYFFIAGMTYMVFWKWCFPSFKSKFLYKEMPKNKDLIREIKYSVLSTMIFVLPTIVVLFAREWGYSKLYVNIHDHSMLWYGLSFLVVFLLHDTYFYWTHRLMHTKKVYPYVHRIHHLSVHPSPMAAFAFHPLEAIVESFLFIALPFFIPLHWTVLIFFTLFSLFMNVYGHLGFSLFSKEALSRFPLNLFSHSTHHSWHHRHYQGNYGFYLQFWDRVMKTWKGELTRGA